MNIYDASKAFERWLSQQVQLVLPDLRQKHKKMKDDKFSFLRATFYRWMQQFPQLDSQVSRAPQVLAVGDLHLENFGTWRDALGRLAWGINDFDEAFPLPYTSDLIRLATSALLAIETDGLQLRGKSACRAIIEGYREGLTSGASPFVIGEEHRWFKPILQDPPRDPGKFWDKLRACPHERIPIPTAAKATIKRLLPDAQLRYELRHRLGGLGSLGKPRFTAIAQWHGGPLVREAKALTLSAAAWAQSSTDGPFYSHILAVAARSPDPFLIAEGNWIGRRYAPDCGRIELSSLLRAEDKEWLLHAMGYETANVHLGSLRSSRQVLQHLNQQSKNWLRKAATIMRSSIEKDFDEWRR